MKRIPVRRLHAVAALAAVVLAAAAGAGAREAPRPPGRLIDVGGYRLHASVSGRGAPAVVFLNGAGDFSFDWALVQPAVSRFARAVSYDRAGDAWSDLGPVPRTLKQEAYELHLLLAKAGVRPPYVLVGHSYGGLLARVYAREYPAETAGMVLVDSTHENTSLFVNGKIVRLRDGATGRPIPPVQTMKSAPPGPATAEQVREYEEFRKMVGPPKLEPPFDRLPVAVQRLDLWARSNPKLSARGEGYLNEEAELLYQEQRRTPHPLGDMPLVVLAGARKADAENAPPEISADEWAKTRAEKREHMADLSRLSRKGTLVFDETSGHHIQLDNPRLVIDSVRRVVEAARPGRGRRTR